MANKQSQLFFVPLADEPSDLHQRNLVCLCVAVDVENECVFVGVMLYDVVVHVYQDPATEDA